MVARRWDGFLSSNYHNTLTIGRLASYFSNALFSPLLMFHHLGMDEFIVLFMMTNEMTSQLEISLIVHAFILSQCWQFLWVAMGHMCNVNMCIMSCRWLCSMGSWKSSLIIAHGIGMKFNACWYALKRLDSSDSTSQLHQIKSIVIFSFIKLVVVA